MKRALAAAVLLAAAAAARADLAAEAEAAGAEPAAPDRGAAPAWSSVALFLGGAATAFAAHEAGHVAANLALGNVPRLAPVTFAGAVPFFSISPDISCVNGRCFQRDGQPFAAGPHGLFAIVSAGFNVQHALDEIILTTDPRLRGDDAPFRKGMLAFGTLTSVGYVLACDRL